MHRFLVNLHAGSLIHVIRDAAAGPELTSVWVQVRVLKLTVCSGTRTKHVCQMFMQPLQAKGHPKDIHGTARTWMHGASVHRMQVRQGPHMGACLCTPI